MRRLLFLLGMFLAGLAVTAAAQVFAPGAIHRIPAPAAAVSPNTAARVDPASDPVLARAEIDRLQRRNTQLRNQFQATLTDLQNARKTLDEMTRPGGSLVTAQCASYTESRTTAGAYEDCSSSGYRCEPVSGMCRRECQRSDECAPGFLCDTGIERCVPQPN